MPTRQTRHDGPAPLHVGTSRARSGWSYTVSETDWCEGQFLAVRTVAQRGEFSSCNAAEIAGLDAARAYQRSLVELAVPSSVM